MSTEDLLDLCQMAYDVRKLDFMKRLTARSHDEAYKRQTDNGHCPFALAKHYIGRLAQQVRAPKYLLDAVAKDETLQKIVDCHKVQQIPQVVCIPAPKADSQTHLQGILRRMISEDVDSTVVQEYKADLEDLDRNHQLLARIMDEYANPNFQPKVHAEIQVLEHFYSNKLRFVDHDRFIACSKDACFCCQLYFRHHPAKPVQPESHQKVYLHWGPPLLAGAAADPKGPAFHAQRTLLTKMLETIRSEALEQIRERGRSHAWHPDSLTGITSTVMTGSIDDLGQMMDDTTLSTSESEGEFRQFVVDSAANILGQICSSTLKLKLTGSMSCQRQIICQTMSA